MASAVVKQRYPVRIPGLSPTAYPPPPYRSLANSQALLTKFLREGNNKTLVITGAGVSVDSGIRAYRGKNGSYVVNKDHRPIFYGEFVASEAHRRRYWARSFLGYSPVRVAEPNHIHTAIAALQKLGLVNGLITQNVDGLHHKAIDPTLSTYHSLSSGTIPEGDTPILELHGTLRHAHCLSCGTPVQRDAFQDKLAALNPKWEKYTAEVAHGKEEKLNPDGDIDLGPGVNYNEFNVPPCESCGGDMKPKVTFFGESLEPAVKDQSMDWVSRSSQILVVGSSLATFSAFRLVRQKKEEGGLVGLINVGESRGDPLMDWRLGWEGGAGEILPDVVRGLVEQDGREEVRRVCEDLMSRGKIRTLSDKHTS
ncbi:NAD-dependent deacetylase sirtuin 4 [Pseudohyphozyma bogoriensis]|nr:NAD-dependent deacetylase sirtuin 4 [Pseudohyphozyma bogoriensis]